MAPHFGQDVNPTVMKEQPVAAKGGPLLLHVDTDPGAALALRSAERYVVDHPDKPAAAAQAVVVAPSPARRRKRDVLRQVSMRLYLKGKHAADDVLRNVAPARLADAEQVCGHAQSSLEHEIRNSRKTRKHLWLPTTQDDSALLGASTSSHLEAAQSCKTQSAVEDFFLSRVTDPTSYFYRFHYDDYQHLAPQKAEVQLVDVQWLKPHEQIVSWERVNGLRKATLSWDAYTEPLLVDIKTGAILDGHHRYNVALQLRLKQVPAVLVDYLGDSTIHVDVWPGCGRSQLTKEEVIAMSLSPDVFPPKTSRHRFTESLPPISIPLSVLRQPPTPIEEITQATAAKASEVLQTETLRSLQRKPSLQQVSIRLICGAQNLATSVTKSLFRGRLRSIDRVRESTQMDLIRRPSYDPKDFFNAIRENDPTSSFCRQKAATLEDLLSDDKERRQKFFLTRITDPTSYFYKYHFDARPQRQPKKLAVHVASLRWLKAHEHVVSWDRVDGLRRATVRWNAYLEPLLVDIKTGAILDGHHRYNVGLQLKLECVPVVLVDYLEDESITVDVWPKCGRDSLTKQEVIDMSLSDELFPPKTSRHSFSDDLPPISVPLERLRKTIDTNYVPV